MKQIGIMEARKNLNKIFEGEAVEVTYRGKILGRIIPNVDVQAEIGVKMDVVSVSNVDVESQNVHINDSSTRQNDYLTPEKRAGLERMGAMLASPVEILPPEEIEEPEEIEVRYVWNELLGEMSAVSKEDVQRIYGKGWENKWRKLPLHAG